MNDLLAGRLDAYAVFVPAKTPAEIVQKIQADVVKALDVKARFELKANRKRFAHFETWRF